MQPLRGKVLLLIGLSTMAAPWSRASAVFSPTSVVYNQAGDNCACGADIVSATVDEFGMSGVDVTSPDPFISGITDWSTYFSGVGAYNAANPAGPLHDWQTYNPNYPTQPADYEWFGTVGDTTNQVLILNMGQVLDLQAMALWNEDSTGLGTFSVFICGSVTANTCVSPTSEGTFTPATSANSLTTPPPCSNPVNGGCDYGAQLFTFTNPGFSQYVELEMNAAAGQDQIALGQVAFESPTPEPGSGVLLSLGLAIVGLGRWVWQRRVVTSSLNVVN